MRRLVGLATAGAVAVMMLTAVAARAVTTPVPAPSVPHLSVLPVYPGDFPDPDVIISGGHYVVYGTGSAGHVLQVMTSGDLRHWGAISDPLPLLPLWAGTGPAWAPEVFARPGGFALYFTHHDGPSGRQCIGVATSDSATGPFVSLSPNPLVCDVAQGGSIDPDPFVDAHGTPYLLWKDDGNAIRRPSSMWVQQLSGDGQALVGRPRRLLTPSPGSWQRSVVEGPSMVAAGNGYDLFFGGNHWDTISSAIGWARCATPLGPCVDQTATAPWLGTHGRALAPAGPAPFRGLDGRMHIAYHAWTGGVGYGTGGVRSLWVDDLGFRGGVPQIG